MTATMTICPTSMASRARRAAGTAAIRRITAAGEAGRGASAPIVPSTSNGSGRSQVCVIASPARNVAEPSKYGPANSGRPMNWAKSAAGPSAIVGPAAAPKVEAHTSIPMARARRSSGARSATA